MGYEEAYLLDDIAAGLNDPALRVVIFGEFNAGKSTLINAMLGRKVLPARCRPTTGHITRVFWGPTDEVRVHLRGGKVESCPLADIESFAVLDIHCRAREDVDFIDVFVNVPLLQQGLVLIDTPGVHEKEAQTNRARRAVAQADLVLFVLRATQLLGMEECKAMSWMTKELRKPVVPVLNYVNQTEPQERHEIRQRIDSWARQFLKPTLDKLWFEVNALGALRHVLQSPGAPTPNDDFFPLLKALANALQHRRLLQKNSRLHQLIACLQHLEHWNNRILEKLAKAYQQLVHERKAESKRLQEIRQQIEQGRENELIYLRSLINAALEKYLQKLYNKLAYKDRHTLAAKARKWFDAASRLVVETVEEEAGQRLVAMAGGVVPVEPLALKELILLTGYTPVNVVAPDNSGYVITGALGGAALGALFGGPIGAFVGAAIGGFLSNMATKQEPDYVAAYRQALGKDWSAFADLLRKVSANLFQARIQELLEAITARLGVLQQLPTGGHERTQRQDLARQIQKLLAIADGALGGHS